METLSASLAPWDGNLLVTGKFSLQMVIVMCRSDIFFVDGPHYRKISNIRRTKSPHLNVSRLVSQLSLPNPMKPGVKSRMKM